MDFPEHPFWDFAIRVYRTPGVSAACLEVQERLGVDVNVLLFCCWLGESGRGAISREGLARARESVAVWHESVVKHLRSVRRILKDGIPPAPAALSQALRAQIQAHEIDAEHIEQLMLAASVDTLAVNAGAREDARAADAVANVGAYVQSLGMTATAADRAALARIVLAAFPGVPGEAIEARLSGAGMAAFRPPGASSQAQ
jgi:uncharacterized protein (TIGR02444 family)